MRKDNSDFKTAFLSEAGSQLENRDYFGYVELDDYACWVMAKGLDNSETRPSAAMVVKEILMNFTTNPGFSKRQLREYMVDAHKYLRKESKRERLKASVLIVVTNYMTVRYASAGNIHLQIMRQNSFFLESKDQSYYQQKVDDDTYPKDRSRGFRERSNLTNYVGRPGGFRPYISKKIKVKEMDAMVLTTVGLWESVTNGELLDAAQDTKEPQELIDNVEDILLSKQLPMFRNYTIATIFVNRLFLREKKWWPKVKIALIILIPLLIIIGIIVFFQVRAHRIRMETIATIETFEERGDRYIRERNYQRGLTEFREGFELVLGLSNHENDELELKKRVTEFIVDGNSALERDDLINAKDFFIRARDYIITYPEELRYFNLGGLQDRLDYVNTRIYINELIALGDIQLEAGLYASAILTFQSARTTAVNIGYQAGLQTADLRLETARARMEVAESNEARAAADLAAAEAEAAAAGGKLSTEELAALFEDVARQYEEAGMPDQAARMRGKAQDLRTEATVADQIRQEQVAADLEANGDEALRQGYYEKALAYFHAAQVIYIDLGATVRVQMVGQKIMAVNDLIRIRDNPPEPPPPPFFPPQPPPTQQQPPPPPSAPSGEVN